MIKTDINRGTDLAVANPVCLLNMQQRGHILRLPEESCLQCFVCAKLKPHSYVPSKPDLVCPLLIFKLAQGKRMDIIQREVFQIWLLFSSQKTNKGFLEYVISIFLYVPLRVIISLLYFFPQVFAFVLASSFSLVKWQAPRWLAEEWVTGMRHCKPSLGSVSGGYRSPSSSVWSGEKYPCGQSVELRRM